MLPSSSSEEIISSMRSLHMMRDVSAKGQTSQTPLAQETLPGHITHRSLLMTGPAHICALHVSVRLPEQTSGSSSGLPRQPTLLGILFGSAAHCPHRKHIFLCPLRFPKTKVPWPSCFLQIFNILPHGATPCICNTWSPIPIPRHLGKRESSFTSGGTHPLSTTFVVPMEVRNAPPCLRRVSSSAPSRDHHFRKICELRLHHWPRLHVLFQITNFHRKGVHHGEPSEPTHYLEPTFLWKALYHHVDWAVTIFLLVCQEFAVIKLSQTSCGAACARNTFASRRSLLSCVTKILFGSFQ